MKKDYEADLLLSNKRIASGTQLEIKYKSRRQNLLELNLVTYIRAFH